MNLIEKAFLKATEQEEQKRINLKKKYPKWTFVKAKPNKTKLIKCKYKLDLAKSIYKYYNTGEKIAIQYNRKLIYNGIINFELQTGGTYAQQNSYLQITINKFVNQLLTN
tara:strand:- start:84 stop:413 length:330 start_codon:yes stop_codon:yes gene_type:complete